MERPVICWFKRDLRCHDHEALARAAGLGPVLPLYIIEPELWAQPDASARHYGFLRACLEDLRHDLARHGLALVIRQGAAVAVLERLRAAHGVTRMISHEETGNGWSFARDRAVAGWARASGVAWQELPQAGVVRRLPGRDGWAARRDARMTAPQVRLAGVRGAVGVASDPVPDSLSGPCDPCPAAQPGGRRAGLALLDSFLGSRGQAYRAAMSRPDAGARACSRLSPHLAFGTLSSREVEQAAARSAAQIAGHVGGQDGGQVGRQPGWAGSMKSFRARLAWRDHFMQKLEDTPALEHRCLHPAYEGLRSALPDATRLAAWSAGETGLPFVDACMRSLRATGWLNFRARAMLVAVASYHLWLDWRATGSVLARLFTDYEPGIHWSQMQMQSGTTGMNTIRIYNPVKQGRDNDPTGAFTRRWLPELAAVPDDWLQEPWRWPGAGAVLGRAYPAPVVDPARAARRARDAVWAVRRAPGFAETAAAIVQRHASRKDRARRFVRDRNAIPPENRQLGFDF